MGQAEGRGADARERGVVAGKSTKVGAWETRPRRHPGEEEEKELLGWRCRPWGVWSLVESYLPVCAPWAGTRGRRGRTWEAEGAEEGPGKNYYTPLLLVKLGGTGEGEEKKTQLLRSSGSSVADRKVKKKEMRYFTEG